MAVNVTVKIDDELARSAKIYAARHGTSISRLVADQLERIVLRERAYEAAKKRALNRLERAAPLGWQKPGSRDDVHAR
jgi:hypothetical protein